MGRRYVKEEIDRFHDYSVYIPSRVIYMGSESYDEEGNEAGVDGLLAERIIKNLVILDTISEDPITIIANNVGGDVSHSLAIFDAIRACKSKVIVKVFGNVCSMGSVILQAASERIMAPNAVQMVHYGSSSLEGHELTVLKQADELKRIDRWMEEMYLDKIRQKIPNFKMSKLKHMLDHDTYLTAEESVELGLADGILGSEERND